MILRILKLWILSIFFFSMFVSCKNESIKLEKLSGYVQKGPFIIGTSISLNELSSKLIQTGKSFNSQITNNDGSFEIQGVTLESSIVQLQASGFYFNEVSGKKSTAPLTLYAIGDVNDASTLNVNVLTDLERLRVKYLVSKGEKFKDAKRQAISEVLKIFYLSDNTIDSPELLNISGDSEEDAILLAVSIILQGNRTDAELAELLANISIDLQEDGRLDNQTIGKNIVDQALELNLHNIRVNIENRFNELGKNIVPANFEKYINHFVQNSEFKVSKYELSKNSLDLGEYESSSSLFILNKGNGTVEWSLNMVNDSHLHFNLESGTVNPFDSVELIVSVNRPFVLGNYNQVLSLTTNVGNSVIDVSVKVDAPAVTIVEDAEYKVYDISAYFSGNYDKTSNKVNECGFCWGQNSNPTILDNYQASPNLSEGYFFCIVNNLEENTNYYIRSYVKNVNSGYIYSEGQLIRKTKKTIPKEYSTVTDFDGNVYKTVKIGNQWWTAENLKSMHYSNGEALVDGTQIEDLTGDYTTKYYFLNGYMAPNTYGITRYGLFYTSAAVNNGASASALSPSGVQGICPKGWHVPSNAEYNILNNYMLSYGYTDFESSLHEVELQQEYYWKPDRKYFADPAGFGLMYGGVRGYNFSSFAVSGVNVGLWLSNKVSKFSYSNLNSGYNCRCVKDE